MLFTELADAQKNTIKLEQQQSQSLENDVRTLTNLVDQQQKQLDNLKLERDRTVSNTHASANKIDDTQSQLTIRAREIMELTWELNDVKTKLKHTQHNLDAIMAERATLQRNVDAMTDDRNDARERLRVSRTIFVNVGLECLRKQICVLYSLLCSISGHNFTRAHVQTTIAEHNKLKQIVGAKSAGNARAMRRIDRIEKEKNTMKSELLKGKVAVQHIRSEYIEKEHERKSLCRSLSEKEHQSVNMTQKLEAIQNEKDRIDAKLVKRNVEHTELQEKLDIMQAALDRG